MTTYDTRDHHEDDEDDEDDEQDEVRCKRCGKEGLVVEMVGGSPKLFEHTGLRLRDHKCDFTNTAGFD